MKERPRYGGGSPNTKYIQLKNLKKPSLDKYWSQQIQEDIRDSLEDGKHRHSDRIDMVQYMDRKIMQCRQLIPPIADYHLIKKLARHFNKEVEIAVMTRGIREIPQFETLLREYMYINKHMRHATQQREVNDTNTPLWVKQEPKRVDTYKGKISNSTARPNTKRNRTVIMR